jgi:uncharacterized protein (TIGR02118 family)
MAVDVIVLYGPPADPAAFDRHYREVHVPLVHAMPQLVSFEHSTGGVAVRGEGAYHLVARLRFPSQADHEASLASPEGAAVAGDVANFADGGVTILTVEVVEPARR